MGTVPHQNADKRIIKCAACKDKFEYHFRFRFIVMKRYCQFCKNKMIRKNQEKYNKKKGK